ncbi:uroporphyrinogen-III C-methyltransferase [Dokdonella soli]|uniref:Uroporphyrin-3 C-methyltransferase n=1 Tax=Dokdonella soli TaxID=529810 RepID=A0ABN1IEH3_9GAMM
MSEDIDTAPVATTNESTPRAAEARAPAPRAGGIGVALLIALGALGVGGVALWRAYAIEHGQADAQVAMRNELAARVDDLSRGLDQRKRDLDSLRARLTDADSVNKSVREELLGLGERSRHLEDAVANLAEQRMSGRDALAMNEAEFLLQQAQERLALFHDAQAAIAAYQLADSALAATEDPMFASVRQTINAEKHALEASKPVETQGALAALERVRSDLATLPLPQVAVGETASPSHWQSFLAQFVHISHSGDTGTAGDRDIGLTRSLAALDLRSAEAALLARDADAWQAALKRARAGIAVAFDAGSAPTKSALAELDRLAATPLAPAMPELGSALKELRNLRATRVLSQPPASKSSELPASAAVPAKHDGAAL